MNGLVNPADLWRYSKHDFAPRVSFAYDLKGDGKTSIRGGYGIFNSREILGAFILMSGNPPFQQQATIYNTSLSNPKAGTRGFDVPLSLGSNSLNQNTPYTEQWNFNIQRTLGANLMLEIGYAGSHGLHMMRTKDVNQPLPNVGIANKTLNANQYRPYLGYGIISNREQSYASKYNGLQVELSRRFSHGLMFRANYTWSKALDTTDCCSGNIYNFYPEHAEREPGMGPFQFGCRAELHLRTSSTRFRSCETETISPEEPWEAGSSRELRPSRAAFRFDPVLNLDQAGVGSTARQRPQVSASPVLGRGNRTVGKWFDPASFAADDRHVRHYVAELHQQARHQQLGHVAV